MCLLSEIKLTKHVVETAVWEPADHEIKGKMLQFLGKARILQENQENIVGKKEKVFSVNLFILDKSTESFKKNSQKFRNRRLQS